jgi:hypothetical protein
MTISQTLRFLLKKYSSGGDPHPNRAEFNLMIDAIENNGAMFSQGITDARPAAGKRGRFYWDETAERLYYDNGATWKDANPNGGGGAGKAITPGTAAAEGVSSRAARADHTHPIALATATVDGAMPKADKAKLDAATDAATASAIARRDTSGRISVGTPVDSGHATTKTYVDGLIIETADYAEGLVNAVRFVCTSTTRPGPADRFVGQEIYETDTKRSRLWDGAEWECFRQPWALYTPTWNGFDNLGSGYTVGGSYSVIGPRTVKANMFLRGGVGAVMGNAGLSVSLPFPAAGYPQQSGIGSNLITGPTGPLRALIGYCSSGASNVDLWAWPDANEASGAMRTPGEKAYPFAANSEIHFAITFESDKI